MLNGRKERNLELVAIQSQTDKEKTRTIEFRISRFKQRAIDPPRFQSFALEVNATMTVLDSLEQIRLTQDPTLVYRHSCHHSACGTCACIVNGTERLACITRVWELQSDTVVVEPLRGFAPIADLAVDMTGFYRDIDPDWAVLRTAEPLDGGAAPDGGGALRLENCIECGACVSVCPAARTHEEFMGPAALAALHNQMKKAPTDQRAALLARAAAPDGERLCERALACSRVCPTGVYPARHIAELRRLR
jgi:succinate dehydrogenase / fumarate reductase iron-sulfur subunit